MIFEKPIISVISMTDSPYFVLYIAARNCYSKNGLSFLRDEFTIEKAKVLLNKIALSGHWSVFEHVSITFHIDNISRSLMAQLTRHRLASFLIQSQHYQDYSDFSYKKLEIDNNEMQKIYNETIEHCNSTYKLMLENKVPNFIAREILPNAALARIVMTVNLRELNHIIKMRITPNNTPEIRLLSRELLNIGKKLLPEAFIDIDEKTSFM